MSTFREFRELKDGSCFWCQGAFRTATPVLVKHEKTSIETCPECAVDVGQLMLSLGWQRYGAAARGNA